MKPLMTVHSSPNRANTVKGNYQGHIPNGINHVK